MCTLPVQQKKEEQIIPNVARRPMTFLRLDRWKFHCIVIFVPQLFHSCQGSKDLFQNYFISIFIVHTFNSNVNLYSEL